MRAIDARNAFIMTTLLQDVIASGTATRKALELKRDDLAGKTGTTNDHIDAWFCGFNSSAWSASLDRLRPAAQRSATDETGGGLALPIWIDYMQRGAEGRARRRCPSAPAGRGVVADQSGDAGCATTRAGCPDWFFAEFTPRMREDALAPAAMPGAAPRATCATSSSDRAACACRSHAVRQCRDAIRPTLAQARREDRARIADLAARLIVEHGITDWSLAKRKAARQLLLPERTALPRRRRDRGRARRLTTRCSAANATRQRSALSARKRSLGCASCSVRAEADRRRCRRMGDRAQRHPHRARRRRLEGGRARADQRANRVPRGARRVARRHARRELCIDTPRGGVRLVIRTPPRRAAAGRGAAARMRLDRGR